MKPVYLDHAAATPLDPSVLHAMRPYFEEQFYNPSAVYLAAQQVSRDLGQARSLVAQTIGARPVEITFTAGGTEANNLALSGIMRRYPQANLVVGNIEHDSVLVPATQYNYRYAAADEQGIVQIATLRQAIDDQTVLVSLMYANNEIGTVQPVRDLTRLVADIRKDRRARGINLPLYVHTDAAQAGNYLDIHVARLGVDLMTLNGGKLYGPKQSGVLYVRSGLQLQPLLYGGGQEHNLRSGTENVAGSVGFARALGLAQELRAVETRRMAELQQYFMQELQSRLPDVIINGSLKKRLPNNVHITLPGQDNERLLFGLDERDIMAAAGSACSASSDEPSHVLGAIGLDDDTARTSLRFSMGRATSREQVSYAVTSLAALVATV